jgi:hypothetical protein
MIFQVPVIAVFTKYDQFKRDIKMKLVDEGGNPETFETEAESVFNNHYWGRLSETPPFVRLESEDFFFSQFTPIFNFYYVGMHQPGERCTNLIDVTANALSAGVVYLMLMAVQRDNLELSVKQAIQW